jgi:hypothetical protein
MPLSERVFIVQFQKLSVAGLVYCLYVMGDNKNYCNK